MSATAPTRTRSRRDTDFDVVARPVDGEMVVCVTGEVDLAAAPRLRAVLEPALPDPGGRLVVDLSETTFIDSSALGVLVRALKRLRHHGGDLVLRHPSRNARRVFQLTGLDLILTIED